MGYREEEYQDRRNAGWAPSPEGGIPGLVKTLLAGSRPERGEEENIWWNLFSSQGDAHSGARRAAEPMWLLNLAESRPAITGIRDGADDYYRRFGGRIEQAENRDQKRESMGDDSNNSINEMAQGDNNFGRRVLEGGEHQLGLPYVLGGDGVNSTDCGKFTLDNYKKAGVDLGTRLADEQHNYCQANGDLFMDITKAKPGDLVFFKNTYGDWEPGTITHVGIYAGDGKMLHAGSSKGVSYTDITNDYWKPLLAGFGRVRPASSNSQ